MLEKAGCHHALPLHRTRSRASRFLSAARWATGLQTPRATGTTRDRSGAPWEGPPRVWVGGVRTSRALPPDACMRPAGLSGAENVKTRTAGAAVDATRPARRSAPATGCADRRSGCRTAACMHGPPAGGLSTHKGELPTTGRGNTAATLGAPLPELRREEKSLFNERSGARVREAPTPTGNIADWEGGNGYKSLRDIVDYHHRGVL